MRVLILSHDDVYAALTYFWDNRAAMLAQMGLTEDQFEETRAYLMKNALLMTARQEDRVGAALSALEARDAARGVVAGRRDRAASREIASRNFNPRSAGTFGRPMLTSNCWVRRKP